MIYQEFKDALRGIVGQGCQFDDALLGLSKGKIKGDRATREAVRMLAMDLRALAQKCDDLVEASEAPERKGMTLAEVKAAVDAGKDVRWANTLYVVVRDSLGQYFIKCTSNGSCIGLTWMDGVTLNGQEGQFFIVGDEES